MINIVKLTSAAGLIFAAVAVSAPVNAAPITFGFGSEGPGGLMNPPGDDNTFFEATNDGVTLEVTGWKDVNLVSGELNNDISASFDDQERVSRDTAGTNQGLGVNGERGDNENQVDGEDGTEALLFSFDVPVLLESILFNNVDDNDDFAFILDGVLTLFNEDIPGSGLFTFDAPLLVNSSFAIGADTGAVVIFEENFKVRNITVSVPTVSVPEPATLGLLGIGLVGFGLARQRRKNA